MNKKGARVNVEKQEEVVSILWEFASNLQHNPNEGCLCTSRGHIDMPGAAPRDTKTMPGTVVSLKHVETALAKVMKQFGYNVASIQ
jgi:hypothetical protein